MIIYPYFKMLLFSARLYSFLETFKLNMNKASVSMQHFTSTHKAQAHIHALRCCLNLFFVIFFAGVLMQVYMNTQLHELRYVFLH